MKIKENMHMPVQKCKNGCDISQLSDIELIAIIIGTGSKNYSVLQTASNLYESFKGFGGIRNAGIKELSENKGIGYSKALKLQASMEIGKRILRNVEEVKIVDSPSKVWKLVLPEISGLQQEEFRVILLNNKNHLIKHVVTSKGTINETITHPREIFRDAVKESAASIIIVHNHPSGDVEPSNEDLRTTNRLLEAGKIIGIPVIDHVVVSSTAYLSMAEYGYLKTV